jgi:hypothetical protein
VVLDSGFKLAYRDEVLNFVLPLFPPPTHQSPHVTALTRLLVTLSSAPLTVRMLTSLVPKDPLLAYQFAFDFVEGGTQDYLESVRNELPEGEGVCDIDFVATDHSITTRDRPKRMFMTKSVRFSVEKRASSSTASS